MYYIIENYYKIMLILYFFFIRLLTWYFLKRTRVIYLSNLLIKPISLNPYNPLLGYKYIINPKKYIFFSYIKNFFYNNIILKKPRSSFVPSHILTKKIYFIYFIRGYFEKIFLVANRDPKLNRFFLIFRTWNATHIAYYYYYTVVFILLRIGFTLNLNGSLDFLKKNIIFMQDKPIASRWVLLSGTQYLFLVYNKSIFYYLLKLRNLFKKYKSMFKNLGWNILINKKAHESTSLWNNVDFSNMFFSAYILPNYNPCFLTLSFIMWVIPWKFTDWYWYKWVNWMNFLSHNWKYLS